MRKLLIAVSVVGVLLVGLGAYVVMRFDPETLGREVIDRVNEVDGVTLDAESFRLGVLRGLSLENARATIQVESGELSLELDRLLLSHQLLPLLRRRVVVDRVLLERPRFELLGDTAAPSLERRQRRSGRQPSAGGERDARGDRGNDDGGRLAALGVSVASIEISGGSLLIRDPELEHPEVGIEDLDLRLSDLHIEPAMGFGGISGQGTFSASSVVAADLSVTDVSGEVSLRERIVELGDVSFRTDSGRLEVVEMVADLNADPFDYRLSVTGGVDLNRFIEAAGGPELGAAELQMQATGLGPALDGLSGDGVVDLAGGLIPSPPMIQQIEALLGRDILRGRRYEPTEIHFEIAGSQLHIEPFDLVCEQVRLGTSGRIDLAGPLDLLMQVRAPRADLDVEGVTKTVLDSLTDAEGWVTLSFDVTGTAEEPSVRLAAEELQDLAIDRARDALEEEAKKLLGRLFD